MAMVTRANRDFAGIGGHISTFASSATLYEVGFNHFFRGRGESGYGGDQIYFQGHASPGMYCPGVPRRPAHRSRTSINFRRELQPGGGLSSYPHPWLMPDFWEFPTVSMGLGPIMAIYQARFNRYLTDRGIDDLSDKHVWAFLGDGECDEPETLGAITLASREQLDNLIFVINCNLQRLDGPVRGNGKIIQELEGAFRGAGWNVIKVIWGDDWDPLLEQDETGLLAAADDGSRRRPVPEVRRLRRRLHPRALLRQVSRAAGDGEELLRREAAEAAPRRPRSGKGLRGLQGGRRVQGQADRHPRQDDQGLRPGRRRRRPQHDAQPEEAQRRGAARVPHAVRHSDLRRATWPKRRSTARRKTARR